MLTEEITILAKKFAPPAALWMALSMFPFFDSNGVWYDWPIFGEFQMTYSLKAVLIALIWFFTFAGWGIFRRLNKSWFYSRETKDATVEARKIIMLDHKFMADNQPPDMLVQYKLKHLEQVTAIASMLQDEDTSSLFLKSLTPNNFTEGQRKIMIDKFFKKTNWAKSS